MRLFQKMYVDHFRLAQTPSLQAYEIKKNNEKQDIVERGYLFKLREAFFIKGVLKRSNSGRLMAIYQAYLTQMRAVRCSRFASAARFFDRRKLKSIVNLPNFIIEIC